MCDLKAAPSRAGWEMDALVEFIIARGEVEITEEVLMAAAENNEVACIASQCLLKQRSPSAVRVTEKMLEAVARNGSY
jgi:hypothetical protein